MAHMPTTETNSIGSRRRLALIAPAFVTVVAAAIVVVGWSRSKNRVLGPAIECERTAVDVGLVHPKSIASISMSFQVSNLGSETVQFSDPVTTCRCLAPSFSKKSLRPGESVDLGIGLKQRSEYGAFLERVDFPTNDPKCPILRLAIRGEFWPVVVANPASLSFGAIRVGDSPTRRVELISHDGKPFSISSVSCDPDRFSVDCIPAVSSTSNRVQVTFRPRSLRGERLNRGIAIQIQHPELTEVIRDCHAEVLEDYRAIPARLLAMRCEPGATTRRAFEIEGPPDNTVQVSNVSIRKGAWEIDVWKASVSDSDRRVRIEVVLKAPERPGIQEGALKVACDDADSESRVPDVIVPFAGFVRTSVSDDDNGTAANEASNAPEAK